MQFSELCRAGQIGGQKMATNLSGIIVKPVREREGTLQ